MNRYTRVFVAVAALIVFNTKAHAFKPFGLEKGRIPVFKLPPSNPATPVSAPFDGGLTLLIGAGVAYASKRGYNKVKKDKNKKG